MDTIYGKIIAGKASDTGENLAWISTPFPHGRRLDGVNLVEVARLLARYNGRHVRLTVQEVPEE